MNYLYLRAAFDPAKAGHTPWRGKQANLSYKISLSSTHAKSWQALLTHQGYFILRFGIIRKLCILVFYLNFFLLIFAKIKSNKL
jgi:hypothetical protein